MQFSQRNELSCFRNYFPKQLNSKEAAVDVDGRKEHSSA